MLTDAIVSCLESGSLACPSMHNATHCEEGVSCKLPWPACSICVYTAALGIQSDSPPGGAGLGLVMVLMTGVAGPTVKVVVGGVPGAAKPGPGVYCRHMFTPMLRPYFRKVLNQW